MPTTPNEHDELQELIDKLARALAERGYEVRRVASGYRGFQEEDRDWQGVQTAIRAAAEGGKT